MMRIAHLIMAHKNSLQLEKLIYRMMDHRFDIYIHLDKKTDIESFGYLQKIERVFFIKNRININWGGFSFVNAITESLREILQKAKSYGFINLISSQDYPIETNNCIYHYLEKNEGREFISFEESNDCEWWKHAISRYELYHFTDINIKGRYFVQKYINKILPKRKIPFPFRLYGGSDSSWWTISSNCAQYVVDFLDINPRLMKFMKYTWGADEFLYVTIIMNSPFKNKIINSNLRYIEWEEGKANPNILKKKDLENIIRSNQLFARKFDISIDEQILNEIDRILCN